MKRALILLGFTPFLLGAAQPVLVPDISARSIEIRYSFAGAQLLLFGAILYPGGRVPSDPANVIVVLKGPVEPILEMTCPAFTGMPSSTTIRSLWP